MKKNNQKGFMLVEAFIVSTFVLGVLVFMFVQMRTISNGYDRSFSYNTIPGIYITSEIAKFVTNHNYERIKLEIDDRVGDSFVIMGKDYYSNYQSDVNLVWNEMLEHANVKTVVVTEENCSELKQSGTNLLDSKFKKYIKSLKVENIETLYRIIIEFNDNTYASVMLPTEVEEES